MRRIDTDVWAGVAMLVLSVGVASPVILGVIPAAIPQGWWTAIFLVFLAAILAAAVMSERLLVRTAYGVSVITAWALVITAQQTGLVLILLVVTAAMSVHTVPYWVGGLIIALNTAVIVVTSVWTTTRLAETVILVGFYLLIQVATVLSSAALLREQRMRRELAEANIELRAAGILLTESARTEERLRISRELHDLIGHQLTVLTLELETARHVDAADVPLHLNRADRVARELLGDVRATVGQLRAESLDLEQSLGDLARDLPGLRLSVDVAPGLRLGETQNATLVRAAQEIITNTLRHAEARELWIEVTVEGGMVTMHARDDGRGAEALTPGNGLTGLRERLEALGGELQLDGRDGFEVRARVPAS